MTLVSLVPLLCMRRLRNLFLPGLNSVLELVAMIHFNYMSQSPSRASQKTLLPAPLRNESQSLYSILPKHRINGVLVTWVVAMKKIG